jgi:hypothetical protein
MVEPMLSVIKHGAIARVRPVSAYIINQLACWHGQGLADGVVLPA